VNGPHRDHIIAFARRHGHDAAISVVARSLAPLSQGGRSWPRAESFEGSLNLAGYSIEGIDGGNHATELPLSTLLRHLPVAVLKAKVSAKPKHRRG
jgi:(1->4)-alpha-D-glucan 1-alpha-D-glucosylmutase